MSPRADKVITRGGSLTRARHASAKVSIGGMDVTGDRPNVLRSLRYERTFANSANRAQIVLYDKTERAIESHIIAGNNKVVLSYGYSTGPYTPRLNLWIVDYSPTFLALGTELNLECLNTLGIAGIGEEKRRGWTGRISDIVQAIAVENGWKYEIDRTRRLPSVDGEETTNLADQKFQQSNQTDMNFIREVLLPNASRDSDGMGGYRLNYDDHENKLHFHPPRLDKPVSRVYIWRGRADTGQVIDFRPTISGQLVAALAGARGVNNPVTDPTTGEDSDTTIDVSNTPEKQLLGDFIEDTRQTGVGGALVTSALTLLHPSGGSSQAESRSRNSWYKAFQANLQAELDIIGDPFVNAGDMISVTVMLVDGSPHYASGTYLVTKVVDDLTGGEFKSTLELLKNAVRQGPTRPDGSVIKPKIGDDAGV